MITITVFTQFSGESVDHTERAVGVRQSGLRLRHDGTWTLGTWGQDLPGGTQLSESSRRRLQVI